MERETKTITTPMGGSSVVIKTYLIGSEKRALQGIFTSEMQIKSMGDVPQLEGLKGNVVELYENKALTTVIVSIDGKPDNIIEIVLAMRAEDYDFVVREIYKIINAAKFEEKKTI